MRLSVITTTADILGNPTEPHIISNNDSQLIYGELFQVEKEHGAYVYGYSIIDGYKGYIERDRLIKDCPTPTHSVSVRASHLYPVPSFKSRPLLSLSCRSMLSMTDIKENGFTQTHDGFWVFDTHIALNSAPASQTNLSEIAKLYLGTPYYYGGRSSFGIDCTGLIQQCLCACGYDCPPRDSADQQGSFGKDVVRQDVQKDDVVYFEGHVGIMVDDTHIINATARHMTTLIEPLAILEKAYDDGITHIARL